MPAHDLLASSYSQLLDAVTGLDEASAWRPTRCRGWAVQDLVLHLTHDAQRGLVALHSPHRGPVDTDEVSYWEAWQPGPTHDDLGLRTTRVLASVWSFRRLLEQYVETAQALVVASADRAGGDIVTTQRRRLTVDTLRSTLAVEVTVHQLDLAVGEPSPAGLAEVRRVLDGLLGHPAPISEDRRYALLGTGRERPTAEELQLLGPAADRFPLFA